MKPQPATSPNTPAEAKECHFFKLPPELRTIIYDEVLSTTDFVQDQGLEPRIVRPPLLATCQCIQIEAVPLYRNHLGMMLAKCTSGAASILMEFVELLGASQNDVHAERRLTAALNRQLARTRKYVEECHESAREELVDINKAVGSASMYLGMDHKTRTALAESLEELVMVSVALKSQDGW